MTSKLIAIDLFSGTGGLSQGLFNAGFNVAAAVELDETAAETYERNHKEVELLTKDVRDVSGKELLKKAGVKRVDVLAGCAPCQGFCSLTRKNKKKDPRNDLVLEMARLVEELHPTAVFMENVPGLLQRGRKLFNKFVRRLEKAGYKPKHYLVQMADYGVPQNRRRLVLLAGRGFEIPLPPRTHARAPTSKDVKSWVTLRAAIDGMRSPKTLEDAMKNGGPRKHNWHVVRKLQPQTKERLDAATPGKTWRAVEEKLRPACHQGKYVGFTNTYQRMTWDQASVTITSGCTTPCKGRFGHPSKKRTTISVREAAILQTFPRRYVFATSHMDQVCEMIGNAVPPLFAEVIGRQIAKSLKERDAAVAARR